jgi:predicted MPP superfamily phosphohydrolase
MKQFEDIANIIITLTKEWEPKLLVLTEEVISQRRNLQKRTIKQIIGHMVDSASNNTHRVVHLQYRELPLRFPNYATYGNNERWIAIQNYQDENWENLVQHWKYSNLHFAHVIQNINPEMLQNVWLSDVGEKITLKNMVESYLPHLILHLGEIGELAEKI